MTHTHQAEETAADTYRVRQVPVSRVIHWVAAGWRDLRLAGWPSLLHGLLVFVISILILQLGLFHWPILPAAVSAFLLVGPIMATGLYALSRRIEQGQRPGLADAVAAWRSGCRCLLPFGLLLVLASASWVLVTMLLFYLFVPVSIADPVQFLRYVVIQQPEHFLLWTVLGGLGAALCFGLTVVSVPLMLDREIPTRPAMQASIRAVGENPVTMAIWATLIVIATGLSVMTMMLGFIILYPLMGHASWHVYRDLIDGDTPTAAGDAE